MTHLLSQRRPHHLSHLTPQALWAILKREMLHRELLFWAVGLMVAGIYLAVA